MNKKQVAWGLMILVVGIIVGALITGQFGLSPDGIASNKPAPSSEPIASPEPAISGDDQNLLTNLNELFTKVADEANPSVVTVFTQKEIATRRMSPYASPFFDNPFRDFFGDDFWYRFFGPPQQGEEKRVLRGMGSGVIVSEDGYILTNNHVVRGADKVRVMLLGGKRVDAEIVGTDPKTDLAVLRIKEDNLKPIKMGDSDKLRVGEWVLAIGSPLSANLDHTVTAGIVSAKGRSNVGLADYEDFIQTDAAINPGNSGGALVNLKGELVGINTAIATQTGGFQGIGFAVPINMARQVMDALIKHGKVIRGWLGVMIQNVTEDLVKALDLPAKEGVIVAEVVEDSPAEKAGLEVQDIILELDGKKVEDVVQLSKDIASRAPGTKVELTILRDGKKKTITVELGELPDENAQQPAQKREDLYDKLGFQVANLNRDLARMYDLDPGESGVVVVKVRQNSNAREAGLMEGALIKRVNRKAVKSVRDFERIVSKIQSGDTILLYVKQRGANLFIAFEVE